ncbi:uncharacterized protein LOC130992393 isoform X1 [Salvia miltiorrhiza]|uniref:uncharacterized protein LOC130992393 isoform X1 n=1 Tax=Salvia miltiorrhiza TaxID=226208 RepID=UPI0025AC2BA4|nr:uncharacterized protein LOC130992393 isoform X1 [Salvia miltiorrhiza]
MFEEEEDEDEDNELKICDVCVTPISSHPYYECAACKYFVHLICSLLPKTLSSSSSSTSPYGKCQQTDDKNHKFTLYTSIKENDENSDLYYCRLCDKPTNGMVYRCEECEMIIDVKCASLPTTIKHASHSHPNLIIARIGDKRPRLCRCCGYYLKDIDGYRCIKDGCDFTLHLECALLPPTVRKHEWDHYPLLLTFDASDHPSDFICDFCEVEMHPKRWMYHCRQCDHSYHTHCLKTAFGYYRNIKFGHRFDLDLIHPHPLTFNYITLKKWCDICRYDVYTYRAFACASCYFVVCRTCGDKVLEWTTMVGLLEQS